MNVFRTKFFERMLAVTLAFLFIGMMGFTISAQNPVCDTDPSQCINNENVPYPSGFGKHIFIRKGTQIHFYGIIGDEPNEQIVVTYQPGFTPDTTEARYLWVLNARATAPDFDGWTRFRQGCYQFWGSGSDKQERVCLYEWRPNTL